MYAGLVHNVQYFDAAKKWTIIRPESCKESAAMLANAIALLRGGQPPPQIGIDSPAPEDEIIIINCDEGSRKTSYYWRAAPSRVEIYGHMVKSVDDAAADFLEALGVTADGNGIPAPHTGNCYALSRAHVYRRESGKHENPPA
ncbi:MAG: hypothetical protein LBG74_01615 [Spirochaetaceae bacterium]|nr:hypothetical protein [Spirochaetaceae bacterium]